MAGSPCSWVVPFGLCHYNTCWIMKCLSQVSTAPCHWQISFPLFLAISHSSSTFINPLMWPLYAVRSSGHFSIFQTLNSMVLGSSGCLNPALLFQWGWLCSCLMQWDCTSTIWCTWSYHKALVFYYIQTFMLFKLVGVILIMSTNSLLYGKAMLLSCFKMI